MKKFTTHFKTLFFTILTLLVFGVGNSWGESYEVSLANTSTTTYTKSGEIKLVFSNVSQNSNGFSLTNKIAGLLESSAFSDFYEGNVTWSNQKTGYDIKVTQAEATFKTSIFTLAYGVYGRVYTDSKSAQTNIMYRNNATQTISISDNSGLSSSIAFSTGRNSQKGVTYLNKVKLTYSFTAKSYDVTLDPNEGTGGNQTVSATYDSAMPTTKKAGGAITAPTRNGYTFLGYFDAVSGGTKYYNANLTSAHKWDKASATTLYAHWQENTYTITWPTIQSGLVYTPGEIVQNHWATTGSAKDGSTTVDGSFTCSEELQPAKNSTGYTVTFTPTNSNKYLSHTTTIKQDVAKADQYITWNLQDGKNAKDQYYEYAQGEVFVATSYRLNTTTATGLTVTYTSSDNTIATVEGNELQVHTVGQVVTITASCVDANGNWNDAETVSKTFKTCGVKPNTFNVSGTDLTYGQFLSASTLTGTVSVNGGSAIPGTLTWVEPETFPSAGANQTFEALFTPDNTDAFGSVTFPVTINVVKATPTITWNIGNNLRAESPYNNFVTANNSEASFTITTSSNSLLNVDGMKLTTGSVTNATTGWIRVSLPETDNFNALTNQQLNVTVNPKSDVCLPITTMDAEMYDRTFVSGTDDASWSDEGLLGIGMKYYMLYTIFYTRRTGIQLGDWTEGFTGIDVDMETYSQKSVVLTFNGSPKDISFDVETQYVYVVKSSGIGLGLTFPYPATFTNWYLYESADGANFTQVGSKFNSSSTEDESNTHINRSLKPETRYVKIVYSGNFAGWVKNLQITKRDGYLTADQSLLTFGTNEHPLQDPQSVKITYGALGSCGQTGVITASIDNSHFYLDETNITDNVGFDYNGEYTVRVRCNEVGQTGTLRFRAFNGTEKTVSLTSTTPELTSTGSSIFQTGTEHAAIPGSAYRANTTVDYTHCFNGSTALFDTLYIYGISESSAANRIWDNDALKGYKVPAINVAAGNIYTPCFVYAKNNNKYVYARTCDATRTLNIAAAGKKLGFIGYRPASTVTTSNAILLNGAAGEKTDLYLNNTEIVANGVALRLNSSSDADPFEVTMHARGTNTLSANAAAIQLSAKNQLTIEDSWKSDAASGILALKPATGYPSVDLGGANTVVINGSQLELHNANMMAIVHMEGAIEKTDGAVRINDGSIGGETTLGMPQNTLIDGGTFNDGAVVCYNSKGKMVRPMNSRKEIVSRQTMTISDLATDYAWYGQSHITPVGANVYPMLFGGEGICIFNAYKDAKSDNDINWSATPETTSDAIIIANMEVSGTLTVNSLTIDEGVTVTVPNGSTLIVGDGDSYYENAGNLHVENGGKIQFTTGALKLNDFTLEAQLGNASGTSATSGQVYNSENLDVNGDAYFQMAFDPEGKISFGWYDFVVPFEVEAVGGIYREGNLTTPLKSGVDYLVQEYSESKRAANQKAWTNFTGTMQPGRVYTITFNYNPNFDQNVFVFKKKNGSTIGGLATFNAAYTTGTKGATKDSGWNGLGNGTLRHAQLSGVDNETKVQIYDHASNSYVGKKANSFTFAVGTSFFMQVGSAQGITLVAAESSNQKPLLAPSHQGQSISEFSLALTADGAEYAADHLWVSANEEATGEYTIGRDLLKMGTPTDAKVAQMWTIRNNMLLCDNEMTLINDNAQCALGFFAPQAGEYILSIEEMPEDASLYLTYNNQVIWDLTEGAYALVLEKGTTEGYGLSMQPKRAPQITTGVETVDNQQSDVRANRKVIIDNTLYIVTQEGKIFNVIGKNVK